MELKLIAIGFAAGYIMANIVTHFLTYGSYRRLKRDLKRGKNGF